MQLRCWGVQMSLWHNLCQYQYKFYAQMPPSMWLSQEVGEVLPAGAIQRPFRTLEKKKITALNCLSQNMLSK